MKNILDNFEFIGDTANNYSSLFCKYCKEELRIPLIQPVDEIVARRVTTHLRDCEKFKEMLK